MGGRRDDLADLGRDFDRMTSQLRALIEVQRKLLHDISHELRSPLARLQVAVGLARQQPDKIESSMMRIERESIRMDQLVGELLTLSKLDAGVADSMKESIVPGELLADIVDDAQFEATAQAKQVELIGEVKTNIQGNAELLHRAIENVIRNAIKYTPEGSSVIVQTSEEDTSVFKIIVLDTGPGVAETELEHIFQPFFRSNSPRNNADGHGLGLAIARRVIESHGGSIRAWNRATGGLCVEMTIPITGFKIT
jgi:two-component system OmpR family sensor kinase